MKKNFLGIAALALILTSCSQSEIVENINEDNGVIKFSAISGNVSTKATETLMADLERDGVDIFALITNDAGTTYTEYFTDKLAFTAGSGWATTIATKRYLKEGYKNEFYSIYPAQTGIDAASLVTNKASFSYTIKTGATEDLLGAAAKETYKPSTNTDGVHVTMPFNHLLAQVNLGVDGSIVGLGHVIIKGIEFNQVGSAGTYTFKTTQGKGVNNWSNPSYAKFSMTGTINTENGTPDPVNTHFILDRAAHSLMLVPAEFNTSTITFTFQAFDLAGTEITNGETTGTITLDPTAEWNQGLRYIYLINFEDWYAKRELKFSVSISGWENYDWGNVENGGDGIVEIIKQ